MNQRRNFLGWANRSCTAFLFGSTAMQSLGVSQGYSRLFVDPAGLAPGFNG